MDATPPSIEPLMTVRQASRALNIGRHLIYRAAEAGELTIYDAGSSWPRVRIGDVQRWLERTRRVPRGAA
jgi:excisionase family DNA binding protein